MGPLPKNYFDRARFFRRRFKRGRDTRSGRRKFYLAGEWRRHVPGPDQQPCWICGPGGRGLQQRWANGSGGNLWKYGHRALAGDANLRQSVQNAPNSGSYNVPPTTLPLIITWTNPTPACVLHYTTDGSAPTASSPTYPSGLSLYTTTVVRVIAAATGYNSSAIIGGKWTFNGTPAATPTFSPASTYTGPATTVTISDSTASHTITSCTSNSGAVHHRTPAPPASVSAPPGRHISAPSPMPPATRKAPPRAGWELTRCLPAAIHRRPRLIRAHTTCRQPRSLWSSSGLTRLQPACCTTRPMEARQPQAVPTYPTGGLSIYATTQIRVIAAATGYNSSSVVGGTWTLNLPTCGNPSRTHPIRAHYTAPNEVAASRHLD